MENCQPSADNSNFIDSKNTDLIHTQHKPQRPHKDEEEFRPYMPEVKKGRRTTQNTNRNVVPNIMHQVISYLQKKSKS